MCLPVLLAGVSLTQTVNGLTAREELLSKNPSASYRGSVGLPLPVVELPEKVHAPEGSLTLWADFAAADEKGVPLYVVNQTNLAKTFDSQDHDLYIKLEFKDANGVWKRAQAHRSSWCGNSYYPVSLPPRQYFQFYGYRSIAGSKHLVRYSRRDGSLISNEAEGFISEEDLKAVALDSITASEIPFTITRFLDFREDEKNLMLKERATAVRDLVWYPHNEVVLAQVRELQSKLVDMPAGKERDDLSGAIDEFLAKLGVPRPDAEKLARMCIARIAGDSSADPALSEQTAWRLLLVPSPNGPALSSSAKLLKPENWKGMIAPAVALLKQTKSSSEAGAAAAVLSSSWIVDSLVKNDELVSWVLSNSERLRSIGAGKLAGRSQFKKLVEIGWKQPGPVQIMILRALTKADSPERVRQPDFSDNEHLFWEHCAQSMPVETANALWSYDFESGGNPFNRLIHDPLHDFFVKESAKATDEYVLNADEEYGFRVALQMLASWQMEEDDEVMTALLKHGGYAKQESWNMEKGQRVITKKFILRDVARRALMKRGQPVPGDLKLEEVLSITQEKSLREVRSTTQEKGLR